MSGPTLTLDTRLDAVAGISVVTSRVGLTTSGRRRFRNCYQLTTPLALEARSAFQGSDPSANLAALCRSGRANAVGTLSGVLPANDVKKLLGHTHIRERTKPFPGRTLTALEFVADHSSQCPAATFTDRNMLADSGIATLLGAADAVIRTFAVRLTS